MIFALAVVGGARYWYGVIIAAALFRILPALLNNWGVDADLSFVIFGAGLLHAVITAPDGIAGQVRGLFTKGASARTSAVHTRSETPAAQQKNTSARTGSTQIKGVSVQFGGVRALDGVNASFTSPISGIIGPNGAGKTTLMNVISGFIAPKEGRVVALGDDLSAKSPHGRSQWGLRRSFQKEEISEDLSVFENVRVQIDAAPRVWVI